MKTVGIIAEYNPFHTGHKYHIEETRRITGADCVVVIMSGNFVQRGTPAIADKYTRAESALMGGADLVIELPVIYSTGSAEFFAMGSVSVLNRLSGIDCMSFGGETDNIELLNKIADILCNESPEYQKKLLDGLKKGLSMPLARKEALTSVMKIPEVEEIIGTPNNILAIEYLKALRYFNSSIEPVIVKRMGSGYHSEELTSDFASATALRECFSMEDFSNLNKFMPDDVFRLYKSKHCSSLPIFPEDMDMLLYHAIVGEECEYEQYTDINPSISEKLYNFIKTGEFLNFNELVMELKSKDLTYTRISRALLHILLRITDEDLDIIKEYEYPAYARVLGFNKTGQNFLKNIKKSTGMSIVTNLPESMKKMDDVEKYLLRKDIFATNIYRNIVNTKFKTTLKDEFRSCPVKIEL